MDDLLKKDKLVSIHQRNLQILATEICKVRNDLGPEIMKDIQLCKGEETTQFTLERKAYLPLSRKYGR